MKDGKRVIAVIVGSRSDLSQMGPGLRLLEEARQQDQII